LKGRRADIDAALKLEPASPDALIASAEMAADAGDFTQAIESYPHVLAKTPDNLSALVARGVVLARSGDAAAAERDFANARKDRIRTLLAKKRPEASCWKRVSELGKSEEGAERP
jgi:Flp pilus assembly protein TadD